VKVIDTREGEERVFEKIRKIVDNLLIGVKGSRIQGAKRNDWVYLGIA
jgi:hypothetical protein